MNMIAKWYMKWLLVFHTNHKDIREYTKQGQGLRVTARYKVCRGKQYIMEITEELFELKGKHMRRARRHR